MLIISAVGRKPDSFQKTNVRKTEESSKDIDESSSIGIEVIGTVGLIFIKVFEEAQVNQQVVVQIPKILEDKQRSKKFS